MAENITTNPGSGGDSIAADDIGGVKFQRVKLVLGADGSNDGDVSSSNKMPVSTGLTQPTTPSDTQPISAASLPLPTGAATAAKQPALGTAGSPSSDVISIQGVTSGTVVPISAASLPLPTGAATSANQSTANTSLGNIDTNAGATSDAAATAGSTGTVSAKLRRLTADIDSIKTKINTATANTAPSTTDTAIIVTSAPTRSSKVRQFTTITSSTSETTILTAGGSGVFNDVYSLRITNTSATATEVSIRDATAGTVIDSFMAPAGLTVGFTVHKDSAECQATANNNWTAQCGTSVASIKIKVLAIKHS